MKPSFSKRLWPLVVSLLISLGTGGLSALLTRNSMDTYGNYQQPPLAPPAWLFPVVWTVLFVLMGISAYLVYESQKPGWRAALLVYAIQLAVNFVWPLLFFRLGLLMPAFWWLVLLLLLIVWMIVLFFRVSPAAAYLQIPYLLWTLFAAYLNLAIALLN